MKFFDTNAKSTLLKEFEENIYKKELISKGKETFEFIEKYKRIYENLFDNNHLSETQESVISSNVYGSRFARYLLLKMDYIYSSQDTLAQKTNFVSIEHILPRKPKDDSDWVKDFDEYQREDLTNKLGNLILLSRRKNASLSNRDFNDKKNRYFLKNVNSFTRSTMLMNYNEWTPETLENVHAETIGLLLETY